MSAKHTIETKCRLLRPTSGKVIAVIYVDGKPAFQTQSAGTVEEALRSAKAIREQFEALEERWIHPKGSQP